MRYLFGFLCVCALGLMPLVGCGGEGAGCAEPAADAAGMWAMTATVVSDNCDGRTSQTFRMKITQDGNALTAVTYQLTFSGTICGNQIQMKGSFPEDDGTVTVNTTLNVSAEGGSMQGSDNWTWTDGSESCSGSDSLSGTRVVVDATCSPWCTVVYECKAFSFSECIVLCEEWLLDAQRVSTECADAVRNQHVCLAELTCAEYDAWLNEVPPDAYPCKSASDTMLSVCF